MNVLDSELITGALREHGYSMTDDPLQADAILFNTCSVRQHAEEKIYSAVGKLRPWKREHPEVILGVVGCMAQKEQTRIFERAPHVDLIVGPGQLHRIAELLERVKSEEHQQLAVSMDRKAGSRVQVKRSHEAFDLQRDPSMRPAPFQAFLRIQIGCDKFCSYCVVPMTRGPEQSRSPEEILAEAEVLADQGCLEITLLGQTVNSYRHRSAGRTTRLPDLLAQLHEIEALKRLKFVTNFPKGMTQSLFETVRDLPKCCPYFHVPLQSGSNAILKRMKRGYTVEEYREMIQQLRETVPKAAVSSDFIVGFCGETDQDFKQTVSAVKEFRFKNSFIFKYSERPETRAADCLPDDVPYRVKQYRNNQLLAVQNAISEEDNRAFIDQEVEALVEGPSKASVKQAATGPVLQLVGRTPCDRIVVFDGQPQHIGGILPIRIMRASAHTLFGEPLVEPVAADSLRLRQ